MVEAGCRDQGCPEHTRHPDRWSQKTGSGIPLSFGECLGTLGPLPRSPWRPWAVKGRSLKVRSKLGP